MHGLQKERSLTESLASDWLSSPFSKFLELQPELQNGELVFSLAFKEEYVGNPSLRAFHGGVVSIFIETSAQLYFDSASEVNGFCEAETVTVDFLRPSVAARGALVAVPTILRQGKRVSILKVDVLQMDKLVAIGKVTFVSGK